MAQISVFLIVAIIIAVFFYGSNFVPLKSIRVTNHAFFQLVMCNAILFTALPWALSRQDRAVFQPFAMIGGVSWCIGNFLCPYIIDRLGLGVGFLLWNTCEMLVAWLSSTCGILGVERQSVTLPIVNFAGIVSIVLGGILLSRVDVDDANSNRNDLQLGEGIDDEEANNNGTCMQFVVDEEKTPLAAHNEREGKTPPFTEKEESKSSVSTGSVKEEMQTSLRVRRNSGVGSLSASEYEKSTKNTTTIESSSKPQLLPGYLSPMQEGVLLAVIAGSFFGVALNPTQHLVDQSGYKLDASTMIFSHLAGVCYTSYFLFFLSIFYDGVKSNEGCKMFSLGCQQGDSVIIGPAIFAGVLWGLATIVWFVVEKVLPLSVTFPLFSAGPSIVSTMWSVFYFNEFKTTCDLRKMTVAVLFMLVGLVCICISDQ